MKNMKIGVKMVGCFLLTAIIIAIVGGTSMWQQNKLHDLQVEVTQENIKAIEYALSINAVTADIAGYMMTLLTPYATKEQRQNVFQQLTEGRKVVHPLNEYLRI